MKEIQGVKLTPSINKKSRKLAERKFLEQSMTKDNVSNVANLSLEVYNRLYEVGKKRQHLRNDSQSHKLLLSPNKHTNSTSVMMADQQSS